MTLPDAERLGIYTHRLTNPEGVARPLTPEEQQDYSVLVKSSESKRSREYCPLCCHSVNDLVRHAQSADHKRNLNRRNR